MQREILFEALKLNIARKRRKRWYRVLSAMAAVVVFCTTYAMILPVITMEKEFICGLEEHTHTEACWYTPVINTNRRLECSLELHVHDETCFVEDKVICGYADYVVHLHEDGCFDKDGALVCPLESHKEHEHSEACYLEERYYLCGLEQTEGHSHDDACYSEPQLICQLSEEGHSHSDGCYGEEPVICLLEESEEHSHSAECYGVSELICGIEESSVHSHDENCMSQPEISCGLEEVMAHQHDESCGVEITRSLICGLEEIRLHTHVKECFDINDNLICTELQVLEHQHSEECFIEHTHNDSCWQSAEETQTPEGEVGDDTAFSDLTEADLKDVDGLDGKPDGKPDGFAKMMPLIAVGTDTYRIAPAGYTGEVVYEVEVGSAYLQGFNDQVEYYLYETVNPDGYNKLTGPVSFKFFAEYVSSESYEFKEGYPAVSVNTGNQSSILEANVVNNTGAELPSTGGVGTTIFYVLGGMMVVAALVFLITNKRVAEEK